MPRKNAKHGFFQMWKDAVMSPKSTFSKESRAKHTLSEGALHILVSGIISAIIVGLTFGISGGLYSSFALLGAILGGSVYVAIFLLFVIGGLVGWVISSGIFWIFAKILGGKGDYTRQSFLIAIYSAPLGIVNALLGWMPIVGLLVMILVAIYTLYLLTIVLRTHHRFSTGRAILSWLLPVLIALVLVLILVALFVLVLIAASGSAVSLAAAA